MTAISCHRLLALLCLAAASAGCGATETRPQLGLDTSAPGDHVIVGGFEQDGGVAPPQTGPACSWGGRVVSERVVVTVG